LFVTQANDAYPWTKEFGFGIIDVVQGLRPDQVRQQQQRSHSITAAAPTSNSNPTAAAAVPSAVRPHQGMQHQQQH
jgi:hypothetical protein